MIKPRTGMMALLLSFFAISTTALAKNSDANLKEWTVLVYLNGHNSLDAFGKTNVDGMSQVGSSDQVNVVVQWASQANGNTKRIYINKGGYDVIQDMPPADMGDYNTLIDFVKWAQAKYPAKKYMIDVWNHGNGWHIQSAGSVFHANDISFDDISGHHITTEELGKAMAEISKITGGKIELYASDACLMAMAEVAAEMADSVKYFGGSQEVEPGEGWPYQTFLARLIAKPTMAGGELATALSQEYVKAYSGGGVYSQQAVTFSAWDLSKLDRFYAAVKALGAELKALDQNSLQTAAATIMDVQNFTLNDYKDIGDYVSLLQSKNIMPNTHAVGELTASMKDMLLSVDVTPEFSRAHGISVWLPSYSGDFDSFNDRYSHLIFNQKTGWGDFVNTSVHLIPQNAR